MTHEIAQMVRPATNGQMKDMVSLACQAVPTDLDFDTAEAIGGEKGAVIEEIRQIFLKRQNLLTVDVWRKVYDLIGLDSSELKSLLINPAAGFWTIPVLKGATPNRVVAAIRKKKIKVWTWTNDLDTAVTKNDRDPAGGSYIVRVLAETEAKALANKSADMLAEDGVDGTTLLEALLLWLAYFVATGKYLDAKQVTLCSGSRDSDGGVPGVGWGSIDRGVYVYGYGPGSRDDGLSARSVS